MLIGVRRHPARDRLTRDGDTGVASRWRPHSNAGQPRMRGTIPRAAVSVP